MTTASGARWSTTPVQGHEADFVWPAQRLVVETDGCRARDAVRQAAGYTVTVQIATILARVDSRAARSS